MEALRSCAAGGCRSGWDGALGTQPGSKPKSVRPVCTFWIFSSGRKGDRRTWFYRRARGSSGRRFKSRPCYHASLDVVRYVFRARVVDFGEKHPLPTFSRFKQ